ncbi:hypothetical protein CRG98_001403, partial [Punica granatum]
MRRILGCLETGLSHIWANTGAFFGYPYKQTLNLTWCEFTHIGYSSPAESGLREDLGLSVAAYSVFASFITVGGVLGALVNGMVTDMIGRRGTIWLSEIFCTAGWFSVAFAELMISCGFALTSFVGTIVSWRVLALIGAVPCLLQIIGLFFIPESPRWLVKVGREKEFETALQILRGKNANISQEAADIRVNFANLDYTKAFELQTHSRILDLFQRRYAHALI